MATLLDDQLVTDAMTNLEEWSGDAQRITRTVRIDDVDALVAAVGETADAMDHHPEVSRDGDAVTFTLWTHSAGGVTELDIALASRIDDLVLTTNHLQRDAKGQVHEVGETGGDGGSVTAEANFPTPGETTPSRPAESSTGDADSSSATEGRGAPTMNEPSTPRQDAGMIVAPDAEPGSIEPQPGNAAAPGMHERTDTPDE